MSYSSVKRKKTRRLSGRSKRGKLKSFAGWQKLKSGLVCAN